MHGELNHALETAGLSMQTVHMDRTGDNHCRVRYTVEAFRSQQEAQAKSMSDLSQVMTMAHTSIAERD